MNILLLDDSKTDIELIQRAFSKTSFTLHCLSSGLETVRYLRTNPIPDLVLLDLNMPDFSGCERTVARLLLDVPVLVVTGSEPNELLNLPHVIKTSNMKTLVDKVQEILSRGIAH